MDTQKEIDAMAEALRAQGLTWSQTSFAVSLARNAVAAERERICAALPGGQSVDPQWVADLVRAWA